MTISAKQKALVHVAKSRLGLDDDDYRGILQQIAGVSSSRDLDYTGFQAVMAWFERLGFTSDAAAVQGFGFRPGMASPRQVELIRELWDEYKGIPQDDLALGRWLEHTFNVSSIRFMTYADAHKAIGALKVMKGRKAGGTVGRKRDAAAEEGAGAASRLPPHPAVPGPSSPF